MKTTFVIAAILSVGALIAYALPTQAFADESETNTEQRLAQKNVGSGESTNFNCGENSIDGGFIDAQLCGTADLGEGGSIGDGPVRLTVCHDRGGPDQRTLILSPSEALPHLAHGDTLENCGRGSP